MGDDIRLGSIRSGVFKILILRVLSVNKIFPLRVLTADAISLFLNIAGAIAPVLNNTTAICQFSMAVMNPPGDETEKTHLCAPCGLGLS